MHQHSVAQLWLEPGGLRRHDAAGVGNRHQVVDADRRERERHGGTAELEHLVKSGRAAVAFSLYPVSVDDLMAIADAGGIMPPKSTWFEPKLRDGLLTHLI